MPEVLFFSHLGVRCALPSWQVLAAEAEQGQDEPVSLWNGARSAAEANDDRLIEVSTASGARWLSCSRVRLGRLTADSVWQLSPLLRDVVGLPHVVGLAERENELLWLVDLKRFAPDRPESHLNQ